MCGPRARTTGGQGWRVTSFTKARAPPPRRPGAAPTARNPSSQGRELRGWCWAPTRGTPSLKDKGQRALAAQPKDGGLGEGQCATPDTPHRGTSPPPPEPPSCRPCKLALCAVGLVRDPPACTPSSQTKTATGPSGTPQRTTVLEGRVPNPRQQSWRQNLCHPGRPAAAPTAHIASLQEQVMWGW